MSEGRNLPELVEVMRALLGPEGCPWDKEQTLETLRPYVVEEAHEVVEAIDQGDRKAHREELGDLLFQIIFQSELARAAGDFGLDDVIEAIRSKMVRRHPWVFGGEEQAVSGDEALGRWELQKAKEKRARGALGGVPVSLPALLRAQRVGEKAAAHGYDWPDAAGPRAKVDEELAELDAALDSLDAAPSAATRAEAEAELGDLLFAISSLARKRGLDAEAALRGSLDTFSRRFRHAELAVQADGSELKDLDDEARDALWEQAKRACSGT